jgi:beta-mannosidase
VNGWTINVSRAHLTGPDAAQPIDGIWALASLPARQANEPRHLERLSVDWIPCPKPLPVAAALRAAGRWDLEESRDFDADDWWYRCRFHVDAPNGHHQLHFGGLATLADVWLNGTHILYSESMFMTHTIDVSNLLRTENELTLCFHSLTQALRTRRPRPRWRTGLVAHQQLRWHRTSLLGRIPAWCPPVAPVGPWRPVFLQSTGPLCVDAADLHVDVDGDAGVVHVSVPLMAPVERVKGVLSVDGEVATTTLGRSSDGTPAIQATVRVPGIRRWWPHTHGDQPLYEVRLSVLADDRIVDVDFGRVGFRTLRVDRGHDGNGFGLAINGTELFCRGACWTPLDLARLDANPDEYRTALERLCDAGVNMLRISGTMAYETDTFHDLCDELGILVWQDFMFANMDYPSTDDHFLAVVRTEARQLLRRLHGRPSIAVFCGNSEGQQQAAMLGLPVDCRANALFDDVLADLVQSLAPDAAWVPSTPTGGALPFHPGTGVAHYYGVGAYLRPFEDARRAGVRFAAECLAFANVPEPTMTDALRADGIVPGHHPRWKAGVPRDAGAGWDFEDVRDHYVHLLFGVDPGEVRARDVERYLALGRVATGEAMLRTFAEWRRPGSSCRGGLVWFARDLQPGAGWGVVDASGRPKAAYWYLKRAWAPIALLPMDEGLNGLWLHAINDTNAALDTRLDVMLYSGGRPLGETASASLMVPERGSCSLHVDALFPGFRDLTYAYRFGPPGHDVVAATLRDRENGAVLASAHFFPVGMPHGRDAGLDLVAHAESIESGYAVTLSTNRFACAVAIDAEGFVADDNYIHLEPGRPRRLLMRAEGPARRFSAIVSALNGAAPLVINAVDREEMCVR